MRRQKFHQVRATVATRDDRAKDNPEQSDKPKFVAIVRKTALANAKEDSGE